MQSHINNAKKLTKLLDTKFQILGFKFGIDPLLDLVPNLGNIVGTFISFYLLWIAFQLKLPRKAYIHLMGNIAIDFLLGSVPIAGVIFDAFYKSNVRNLNLIEKYFSGELTA